MGHRECGRVDTMNIPTTTSVYLVWAWDSMASNWGEEYLQGIYVSEALAQRTVDRLNIGVVHHKARWESKTVTDDRASGSVLVNRALFDQLQAVKTRVREAITIAKGHATESTLFDSILKALEE